MNMTTLSLMLAAALALSGWAAEGRAEDRAEHSVVRIMVSKRPVDQSAPWQFEEVEQQTHLGAVVASRRILTSAFAVADGTHIEAQRFGSSKKIALKVLFVDYEVNLALLEAKEPDLLNGLKPLVLADDMELGGKAEVFKTRDSYQLSRLPATLQEVGIYTAVTSGYSVASYLLKVQQSGLGWSEPVLQDGKLAALATGQDSNFVYATPSSLIKHFLEDDLGPSYRGFPAIGVALSSLTAPETRRLIGAQAYEHGVRIAKVTEGSSFAKLIKEDDVVLSIDGVEISEHGFYAHPKWGKVHMKHLLNKKYAGDLLSVKLLREGKPLEVSGTLERFDSNRGLVVTHRFDQPTPHLIFGGLVFQELSRPYLKQWGKDWEDSSPLDLMYAMHFHSEPTEDPTQRIIFVSRVLPDEFNRGYSEVSRQIVESVNDVPVTSMARLNEALQRPILRGGRRFARIKFVREGGEVILSYDALDAAHERMAKTYEVNTPTSFFKL